MASCFPVRHFRDNSAEECGNIGMQFHPNPPFAKVVHVNIEDDDRNETRRSQCDFLKGTQWILNICTGGLEEMPGAVRFGAGTKLQGPSQDMGWKFSEVGERDEKVIVKLKICKQKQAGMPLEMSPSTCSRVRVFHAGMALWQGKRNRDQTERSHRVSFEGWKRCCYMEGSVYVIVKVRLVFTGSS